VIKVKTVFDELETRCPRLGGEVNFRYCLEAAGGLPCSKALICWEHMFPVAEYMSRILTEEEWNRVFAQPGESRLDTILKIAGQAIKGTP